MEIIGNRVAECARGWLGTRFQHQGRLRRNDDHRGGIDCLGLLVGVAAELDLRGKSGVKLAACDRNDYGHIPDGEMLHAALGQHLLPAEPAQMAEGDIALFRLEDSPRHLGIISGEMPALHLIHAYAQARKVVEQPLDAWWRSRIAGVFRLPPQL